MSIGPHIMEGNGYCGNSHSSKSFANFERNIRHWNLNIIQMVDEHIG